jgi:gallate decarboxylase subunit D
MTTTSEGKASSVLRSFDVSESEGKLEVLAKVFELGPDCLVILWGGTRPHVGAVGMAQVRPSLRDPAQRAATSSVFTFVGHKEDMVAKMMSEELAKRLGRNTVVAAGIHWDDLADAEIKIITKLSQSILEKITKKFNTIFG